MLARFRSANEAFPFLEREVRRNRLWGGVLVATPVVLAWARAGGLLLGAAIASVAGVLFTMWRGRWRSRDAVSLLLWSVHWYVRRVPALLGELTYLCDRVRGARRGLIEY